MAVVYSKLKYIKDAQGQIGFCVKLTLNKSYSCKQMIITNNISNWKPWYIIYDDNNLLLKISGRMIKRFFKGIV